MTLVVGYLEGASLSRSRGVGSSTSHVRRKGDRPGSLGGMNMLYCRR